MPIIGHTSALTMVVTATMAVATPSISLFDWAFPALTSAPTADSGIHRPPGASRVFTTEQVGDMTRAVDWYGEGASAPIVVMRGAGKAGLACGFCHLPTGQGRPENAGLAGLPADYIVEQVTAMRAGTRTGARPDWPPTALMHSVARETTPADVRVAAGWFSVQRFHSRTRVVETTMAPKAIAAAGVHRFVTNAPREPLGMRILEGPEDFDRFELRDDRVRYIAYVPTGAIARGRRLAATGVQPCASCHGPGLTGNIGPPLAGRSPTGLFRQLYSFKVGGRQSVEAAPMRAVTANLTTADMIDLAAYAGSLQP